MERCCAPLCAAERKSQLRAPLPAPRRFFQNRASSGIFGHAAPESYSLANERLLQVTGALRVCSARRATSFGRNLRSGGKNPEKNSSRQTFFTRGALRR